MISGNLPIYAHFVARKLCAAAERRCFSDRGFHCEPYLSAESMRAAQRRRKALRPLPSVYLNSATLSFLPSCCFPQLLSSSSITHPRSCPRTPSHNASLSTSIDTHLSRPRYFVKQIRQVTDIPSQTQGTATRLRYHHCSGKTRWSQN